MSERHVDRVLGDTGRVVVVDLGMGNIRSVTRALREAADTLSSHVAPGESAGFRAWDVLVSAEPRDIRNADRVVVPGQGAFRDASRALEGALGDVIRETIASGTPYLGICLGLQVLFEESEEAPGARGLGILEGEIVRVGIDGERATTARVKLPHMGWNQVESRGPGALAVVLRGDPWFYFVHSFHAAPSDRSVIAATSTHGATTVEAAGVKTAVEPARIETATEAAEVVAAVERGLVWATQFHPEKSDRAGRELLSRFLAQKI